MARIEVSSVINAPVDSVWGIVADLDGEPRFWKGTKSVRNISKTGNTTVREITIAFRDQRCMQEVTVEPKTRVHAVFTDGIIKGTKTVTLRPDAGQGTLLEVMWDVGMTGVMGMFTGMVKKHIRDGTQLAVDAIKAEAEGAG